MSALYGLFDFLIHPTFFDPNNPPVKVNISAKIIGIVAAVLGALGILGSLFAIPAVMLIGTATTVLGVTAGVHSGVLVLALIGLVLGLIADIIWTIGGYQMYQEKPEGKSMLVVALALNVVTSLIYDIGTAAVTGVIFTLLINGIIYYFVMISRFSYDAPLATASGPTNPPPSAPPPA